MKPSIPAILIITLLLVGCAPGDDGSTVMADAPVATESATATASPTLVSVPTDIPVPTETPTPVIMLPSTQLIPEGAVAQYGMGYVTEVTPSPDGQYLAIGTSIGFFLYRTDTFEELWNSDQSTYYIAFSSDSRYLTVSSYGIHSLWEVETGTLLQTFSFEGYTRPSFSPDSSQLAYGAGSDVVVWNVQGGYVERTLDGQTSDIPATVFVSDDLLAAGFEDGRVVLWNLTTGEIEQILEDVQDAIQFLAMSPDGHTLAVAAESEAVLWDTLTGETLTRIPLCILDMSFSPDGTILVTEVKYDRTRLWDVSSGEQLDISGPFTGVIGVAFSPDGYLYIANVQFNKIYKIDPITGEKILILDGFLGMVSNAAFSFDGSQLLMTDSYLGEPSITLMSLNDGMIDLELKGFTEESIISADISPDGDYIAAGMSDSDNVYIWEISTGQLINTLDGAKSPRVQFSPDGKWLAFSSARKSITIWDIDTQQPVIELEGHTNLGHLAFSPDGMTLAVSTLEPSVILFELPEGKIIQESEISGIITDVAYAPDGALIAIGLNDGTIQLWETASGQVVQELHGHDQQVRTLDFSSGGDVLASGSSDRTVVLWNVATGEPEKTLSGFNGLVSSVDFSPDGTLLATGSGDGTVILWPVE